MNGRAFVPFGTCITGNFVRRVRRFSVEMERNGSSVWIHTNNTGAMLGLSTRGSLLLAQKATNPGRKLSYTLEAVWQEDQKCGGFWVGVNTSTPERLLEAAFHADALSFAVGYGKYSRQVQFGESRLDACLSGENLPPLLIECKNVTLVEDDVAAFPDAPSERARKHLLTLMAAVGQGLRAAMFYLVQRPDGRCFAPADYIDAEYAQLLAEAIRLGVACHVFRASVSTTGVVLKENIPLSEHFMRETNCREVR